MSSFPDPDEQIEDLYSQLRKLRTEREELTEALRTERADKASVLAVLAAIYPAVLSPVGPGQNYVLYMPTLCGQLSWYVPAEHTWMLPHVPKVPPTDPRAEWDLHTPAMRGARMVALRKQLTAKHPAALR
jgi:hypothetical protein